RERARAHQEHHRRGQPLGRIEVDRSRYAPRGPAPAVRRRDRQAAARGAQGCRSGEKSRSEDDVKGEPVKLTPFAKFFITVVILGVIGYTGYHYYGDQLKEWSAGEKGGGGNKAQPGAEKGAATTGVTKDDFKDLKNTPDPDRKAGVSG